MCWKLHNLDDLSNRVCVPNKTVDLNLNIFDIITGVNESKILTKHISCIYQSIYQSLMVENVSQIKME